MAGGVGKRMGSFHADIAATGLSVTDVERHPILERINAAGGRFRRFSRHDLIYGNAGIRLLSGNWAVFHGVGAASVAVQFDGRLPGASFACGARDGHSQSAGTAHVSLVRKAG